MLTKEQYVAMIARMSEEKCGLDSMSSPRTVKECDPPSPDNRKCGICGKALWKES